MRGRIAKGKNMRISMFLCVIVYLACASVFSGPWVVDAELETSKLSELPPKQAEKSLEQLVQNIDTDGSNGVSVSEMVEWMVRLEKAETLKGLRNQFREADRNSNGFVTLTEFAHTMASIDKDMKDRMDEVLAYSRPIFNGADEDKDGQLSIEEYAAFMHPELHIHMVDVLVESFLEQYDNNDDEHVSFYEFMGIYMPKSADERGREPNWADNTREMFREWLDTNKNGLLDRREMRKWVAAEVTHRAHSEASMLLSRADKDNDGEVSHSEAVKEIDLIAASKLALHHNIPHQEL